MTEQEDAGGVVSDTAQDPPAAHGPPLGAPQAVVPDEGPSAAPPDPAPAVTPARFVTDALGRRYPVDEFGFRIRKSTRPPGFPSEIWNTFNADKKKAVLAEYARALEGHVASPAFPACASSDEVQYALVTDHVEAFLQSLDAHAHSSLTDGGGGVLSCLLFILFAALQ